MTNPKNMLKPKEAAEIANISTTKLFRWIHGELPDTPRLPTVRLGRRHMIRRDTLDRYLSSLETADQGAS